MKTNKWVSCTTISTKRKRKLVLTWLYNASTFTLWNFILEHSVCISNRHPGKGFIHISDLSQLHVDAPCYIGCSEHHGNCRVPPPEILAGHQHIFPACLCSKYFTHPPFNFHSSLSHMCTHTHTCTYTHTYTHARTHTYTHLCVVS